VLNSEKIISNIVAVIERETVFRKTASRIRAAPINACSFQVSGRITRGHRAITAARAKRPTTANPARDVRLEPGMDSLMQGTSTWELKAALSVENN
jgi:hypothetical protein